MNKNQKIIVTVIVVLLIIILGYFWFNGIKNKLDQWWKTNQVFLVDPKNIDQSVAKFAEQYTGEKVKVKIWEKKIDLAFSMKWILDKSPVCNWTDCQRQVNEVLYQIKSLISQWYKFPEDWYENFIELLVNYKLNYNEIWKIIENSWIDELKTMWSKYKMKPIEDRLKPFIDGSESEVNVVACKTLNLVSCKNLYHESLSWSCVNIKKTKCNY